MQQRDDSSLSRALQIGKGGWRFLAAVPPDLKQARRRAKHFRVSGRRRDILFGWKRPSAFFAPLPKPARRMTHTTVRSPRNSGWKSFSIWSKPNSPMNLSKDLREFVELLNSRKIKYLLVGGHAVAFHGFPRFTGDVDFFIDASPENAALVASAISDFGFDQLGLKEADFRGPETVVQLGRAPNRIDILTSVTAVSFAEAWETRVETKLDGLPVWVISKDLLLRNKLATGRPQDLADAKRLG
jgi:hypothetical protein